MFSGNRRGSTRAGSQDAVIAGITCLSFPIDATDVSRIESNCGTHILPKSPMHVYFQYKRGIPNTSGCELLGGAHSVDGRVPVRDTDITGQWLYHVRRNWSETNASRVRVSMSSRRGR